MSEGGDPVPEGVTLDTSVAHPARVYDYWLGGKDNFAADREAAEQVIAANPNVLPGVRANRAFLGRAVRYLAAEAGIRQFLDLGTGLPTAQNTHQVAQEIAPDSRIVYVDNDPIVLAYARALLTSAPEGAGRYPASEAGTERICRISNSAPGGINSRAFSSRFGKRTGIPPSGVLGQSSSPHDSTGKVTDRAISAARSRRSSSSGSIKRKWSGGCNSSHCRKRNRTCGRVTPSFRADRNNLAIIWSMASEGVEAASGLLDRT